ncbi:MAG: hypothetical protein R3E79_32095, partial [Caldilineaceae bacterium]
AYERFWLARASYQDEIQSAEQKGRAEGQIEQQQAMARKMQQEGLDLALIVRITGLSEAEIQGL